MIVIFANKEEKFYFYELNKVKIRLEILYYISYFNFNMILHTTAHLDLMLDNDSQIQYNYKKRVVHKNKSVSQSQLYNANVHTFLLFFFMNTLRDLWCVVCGCVYKTDITEKAAMMMLYISMYFIFACFLFALLNL